MNNRKEIRYDFDTLTQFADVFFDNIFIDLSVQDRIRSSLRDSSNTKTKIQSTITKLNTLMEANGAQQSIIQKQMENYLIGTKKSPEAL